MDWKWRSLLSSAYEIWTIEEDVKVPVEFIVDKVSFVIDKIPNGLEKPV